MAGFQMLAMRLLILCVLAVGFVSRAASADYPVLSEPVLRGSDFDEPPRVSYEPGWPVLFRWEGFYFGAHAARTWAGTNFGNGVSSLVAYTLRNDVVWDHVRSWTTLPKTDTAATGFGGFIGYNAQFEDAVVGVEFNYTRTNLQSSATDGLTRSFQDDTGAPATHHFFYTAAVGGSASVHITDIAAFRARGAWAAGRFLPYAFVGLAVGRGDVSRTSVVAYRRTDIPDPPPPTIPPTPPTEPIPDYYFGPVTRSQVSTGAFAYGYTAGLGIDVSLLPNIFARAEWEWIQFAPFKDLNVNLNTVRVGLGAKF